MHTEHMGPDLEQLRDPAGLTAFIAGSLWDRPGYPDLSVLGERVASAVADTVGVGFAGARTPAVTRLISALEPLPVGPCLLWGSERRTDIRTATLINGTAAHALDFDDVSELAYTHPSAVLVPVICALADAQVIRRSAVIEAYTLAYQAEAALAQGMRLRHHYSQGWHSSGVLGPISAAIAAAHILGLNVDQARVSIGLAVSNASGTIANFGSDAKSLLIGESARNGLQAAQLAAAGYTSGRDALGAFGGLLSMFGDHDGNDRVREAIAGDWALLKHGADVKPYPACSAARCSIDAAIQISRRLRSTTTDIVSIEVTVESAGLDALRFRHAETPDRARFSMHTLVALALMDGTINSSSFTANSLARAELRRLAGITRASASPTPTFGPRDWKDAYSVVRVERTKGDLIVERADAPHGEPWPRDRLRHKFTENLELSGTNQQKANELWTSAMSLASPLLQERFQIRV